MVRKSVTAVITACTLAVLLAQPITASAATFNIYEGNISNTYTTIFRDLLGKIAIFDDYVFFRSGQAEYVCVVGDLTYSGGTFEGDEVMVYRIIIDSDYGSRYSFSHREETDFLLTPTDGLVYSNLGLYPDLFDSTTYYSLATLILLVVGVFMYLIRSIFAFTMRRLGR